MKIIKTCFIVFFLAFSSIGYSQVQGEVTTHQTAAYSIAYPSKSKFLEDKNEENALFKSLFSIYDFGGEAISEFSGITLSQLDCSRLGIGTRGFVEVTERGKTVVRSWNEHSQSAFDELTYEDDGFTFVKHIYVKNDTVYELTGAVKTELFQANYKDIQKIMASFFLK